MNTFYTYPDQGSLFAHYFNTLSATDQNSILVKLLSCVSLEDRLVTLNNYFSLCIQGNKRVISLDSAKDYFSNKDLRIIPLPIKENQYFIVLDAKLFAFDEKVKDCQEIPESIYIGLALTNTNRILVISGFIYEKHIDVSIYDPTTSLMDEHAKSFLLTNGLSYLMPLMSEYTSEVYELINLIYTSCVVLSDQYINKHFQDIEEIALELNASSPFKEDFIEVAIDEFNKRGDYLSLTLGKHTKRARLIHANLNPISTNTYRIRSKITLKDDFDIIIFKVYEPEPSKDYHYICLTNPHDFKPLEGSSSPFLNPTVRLRQKEDGRFEFAEEGISRIHTNLHYISLCELAPLLKQ